MSVHFHAQATLGSGRRDKGRPSPKETRTVLLRTAPTSWGCFGSTRPRRIALTKPRVKEREWNGRGAPAAGTGRATAACLVAP
eukprot:6203336-Pleurochrysis_carterae.AAC.1